MASYINKAKIFSTLGNNSSLVPLGVKDISNALGVTAGAYITGKGLESKDRFLDEAGTQAIWLLGIPFYKKVIDFTLYKIAKFNPNIDVRLLNNQKIFESAKKHAAPELLEGFEKVAKHQKFFKALAASKFVVSTALTLFSYSALTKFRHKQTEKNIMKEIEQEERVKQMGKSPTGDTKTSFKGGFGGLAQFMFDPVKNTMIVDAGITTERLKSSRNPQDFLGYVIKEGGFWAFMYFLGPAVQKHLENKAAKNHKPIDLDIKVLQDETFKKKISGLSQNDIEKMAKELKLDKSDEEIYEALFKKGTSELSNNFIAQIAKESGIIQTIKDKNIVDTQKFIDVEALKGLKSKLTNLNKEILAQPKGGVDELFKQIIKLKQSSILKNIGFSIGALGVVVPAIMVATRLSDKKNQGFQVKQAVYEKMQKEKKGKE